MLAKLSAAWTLGTRPMVALRPTTPQHAAGMRTEPPPSVPKASGPMPSDTAAAAPPLEPPQGRPWSQGLTVRPNSGPSVNGLWPNSGVVVPRTRHRHRVLGRHLVPEDRRAHGRAHARGRGEVLDREGDAVQRAERA